MNISISEILVVVLVALIVIKPEKLPGAAFKLGLWAKRFKATMAKLRHEIDDTVNQVTRDVSASTDITKNHEQR
jgi:Sec-independent protein translocase protein TatA